MIVKYELKIRYFLPILGITVLYILERAAS